MGRNTGWITDEEKADVRKWARILRHRLGPRKASKKMVVNQVTLQRWSIGASVPTRKHLSRLKEIANTLGDGYVQTP